MELTIMLNDAISSIQNLENYYMNQIDIVMKQVRKEMKRYKYGVVLEKFFLSKLFPEADIQITEKENKILESVLETYNIQETDDAKIVQYKIKNQDKLEKNFELNPQTAHLEYIRLLERPQILNDSTIMMLLIKYEEVISRLFKFLINKYPNAYLNKNTITYAELIAMDSDIKDIKNRFLEKEIDEIMRKSISEWYEIFISNHKINFNEQSIVFKKFKEVYYRRNLVVHNQSIVNDDYLSNIETALKKGEKLKVDKAYLKEAFKWTVMVIYDTFWSLKKTSSSPKELEESFFEIGFKHMLDKEWQFSEHIYSLLKEEEDQSEADRICSMINYWISKKNQGGLEEIRKDIQEFDISARSGQFKVAKYALLDDFEGISEILEDIIDNEIPASCIEQWPLFLQYRETENYLHFREAHKDLFEIQDYHPEYLKIDSDDDEVAEDFEE